MKKRLSRIVLLPLAGLGLCLPATVRAGALEETAARVAAEIARDSGRPAADFSAYAKRLARTLTNLSPEALERVLEEHAGAVTGGSPVGPSTPPDDPVVDGPLIDMLNGVPWTPPGTLAANLLEASPLSEAVLAEVMVADDVMPPGGTVDILLENMPLPTSVYNAIVAGDSDLWGSQIQTIVDAQAAAGGTSAP